MTGETLAAIDIGTNSTRLLIADAENGTVFPKLRTLLRKMMITRLGDGAEESGVLSEAAQSRTLAAVESYIHECKMFQVPEESIFIISTSAVRSAGNGIGFLEKCAKLTGRIPCILSGDAEARLSYAGAVSDIMTKPFESGSKFIVMDIGGGSTEIAFGTDIEPVLIESIDVGCVRMSERFIKCDPPEAVEISNMMDYLRFHIGESIVGFTSGLETISGKRVSEIIEESDNSFLGLAGTISTLSALKCGLKKYDGETVHHTVLYREEANAYLEELAAMNYTDRVKFLSVDPGRADVIIGGTAVLCVILELFGADRLMFSEKDILDGTVIKAFLEDSTLNIN